MLSSKQFSSHTCFFWLRFWAQILETLADYELTMQAVAHRDAKPRFTAIRGWKYQCASMAKEHNIVK